MYLYRAININDLNDLLKGKDIECSLLRNFNNNNNNKSKNVALYYLLCLLSERKFALDTVVGHIAGRRLKAGLSPWISTSKNFAFVCQEYAVPQSGMYNEFNKRKSIIIINKKNIYDDAIAIKELRESKNNDITIDLSDGKLNEYYKVSFMSEAYNEEMPNYDPLKELNYQLNPQKYNVKGYSNYAEYAREVLIFKQIKKEDIKFIVYPLLQDIFYGCNVNMDKCNAYLEQNKMTMDIFLKSLYYLFTGPSRVFFNYLYPSYTTGNNLTDYLYDNFEKIPGSNIYEKYNYLKAWKKELLKCVIAKFNVHFKSDIKLTKLVDDDLLVYDMNNPIVINKKQVNDVLIIKSGDNLYRYNHINKKYAYDKKEISKKEILGLVKGLKNKKD